MSLIPVTTTELRQPKLGLRPVLILALLLAGCALAVSSGVSAKNSGHRGGCDPKQGGLAELPQNSMICLMAVVHGVALEVDGDEFLSHTIKNVNEGIAAYSELVEFAEVLFGCRRALDVGKLALPQTVLAELLLDIIVVILAGLKL